MFYKAVGIDEISWWQECSSKRKIQSCLCHEVAETRFSVEDCGLMKIRSKASCGCLPFPTEVLMGLGDFLTGIRQKQPGELMAVECNSCFCLKWEPWAWQTEIKAELSIASFFGRGRFKGVYIRRNVI